MLSRYFVFIAVVASCSMVYGQEKSDQKQEESPRLFRGGLIKRFENLQERLQKEREERQKQRDKAEKDRLEERRKTAESKKSDKPQNLNSGRSASELDSSNRRDQNSNRRMSPIPDSEATIDSATTDTAPTSDLVSQRTTSQEMSLGIEVDPGRIGAAVYEEPPTVAFGAGQPFQLQVCLV